jgi:hypothetical protein
MYFYGSIDCFSQICILWFTDVWWNMWCTATQIQWHLALQAPRERTQVCEGTCRHIVSRLQSSCWTSCHDWLRLIGSHLVCFWDRISHPSYRYSVLLYIYCLLNRVSGWSLCSLVCTASIAVAINRTFICGQVLTIKGGTKY